MNTAILVILTAIVIAVLFESFEFLIHTYYHKKENKVEKSKEIDCNCKIYYNKSRNYYFLKERNKEGKLVYMKGSYSNTEEEARLFCCKN